jgi:hypothetical protein
LLADLDSPAGVLQTRFRNEHREHDVGGDGDEGDERKPSVEE